MDLVYFIILASCLIFVHELGHFLFAKAFGVKVLTFSLGFGPKILRLRGRETEYCIGLIPLGGYVSMLEASKTEVVLSEDRSRTFESLALYKRILIVLAGPAMNLMFPVLLYFAVFVTEGPFLPPTVGVVLPGHPAAGKLEPGDRIMEVNGETIGTNEELQRIVRRSPGETLTLKVFRDNRHVEVEVAVQEKVERGELDTVERYGIIGVETTAPAAVIGVLDSGSPAGRAGLRTFDVVTHVAGKPVRRYMDLVEAFEENHGETVPVTYLRPMVADGALGGLAEFALLEAGVVALTPNPDGTDMFERTGIELADLYAASVPEGSYLHRAGLRTGDKVLELDGEPLPAWSTLRDRLLAAPDEPHTLVFWSQRRAMRKLGRFEVRREEITDEHGQVCVHYVVPSGSPAAPAPRCQGWGAQPVRNWLPLAPEERVDHPRPISYALGKAVDETVQVTRFILVSIVRLLQGRLSLKSLSGPISVYELAGQEGRKGTLYFLRLMAFISLNLALLNLLPIPVLDGGHLLFFLIEAILRRPLPMRAREVAHILGFAVLLLLLAVVFKNDVEVRWDVIRGHVKELTG